MASLNLHTLGVMAAASITAITSEATGFPKEHLFDFNLDTFWKGSSLADQTIDIDLGTAQTIDQFALAIHNYETDHKHGIHALALVSDDNDDGNYSATTNFSTGAFLDDMGGIPIYIPTASPTPTTKRFWRFAMVNNGTGPTVEISGLYLLSTRTITQSEMLPSVVGHQYHNRIQKMRGGRQIVRPYGSRSIAQPRLSYMIRQSDFDELKGAFDDSRGQLYPMLLEQSGETNRMVEFDSDRLNESKLEEDIFNMVFGLRDLPYVPDGSVY